ncbi:MULTISPECIES: HAMP domain-containing sensor histidine kinase [unclassified Nodularia (in: cyanobacteria)]|uniref:sensor histidine kinase n=1 Tax=unclassified Nodularia (in: cyanobacteria) TaxID=2656917 RepID=UPI001880D84E|nr:MULTISPECIES: HAMP domain-containing sensor histidine kinase [unclassified Nodularia (in: cyanobacteria)]MBE9198395.1 HAMP domain-containing histidine kinase [Nodularia sp. LEGE 06071]MCC2691140.1 HAMP domain-containing histidine kinase [Nodularia sp. LEGE 04288]
MNWSNFIYLGVGLILGLGVRGLFTQSLKSSSSLSPVKSGEQPQVAQLLQQVKQTQLAYQMAQEMSLFKAGFLARTTHELRSPLNGLIGLHQLILEDLCENPEEEREFITQGHERALKLLHLIDEILNIARTEHGTNKLDIQPHCLATVLQEVNNLTYMLAANRNFPLRVVLPDPEIYVLADYRWLRQILVNLVDTAIAQMQFGSICLSCSFLPKSNPNNPLYIWLDVPTHALTASESIDLMKSGIQSSQIDEDYTTFSPGMNLLVNQTLLEVMGGKLEIVPYPMTEEITEELTRLQVSIPPVIPEAGLH